jgi:hypothetical protein
MTLEVRYVFTHTGNIERMVNKCIKDNRIRKEELVKFYTSCYLDKRYTLSQEQQVMACIIYDTTKREDKR